MTWRKRVQPRHARLEPCLYPGRESRQQSSIRSSIMSRFSITRAVVSSLALGAGACSSTLEPTGAPITQQDGVGLGNPSGDDKGGLTGGQGADDPAGDDHGGNHAGHGGGGADDPANHQETKDGKWERGGRGNVRGRSPIQLWTLR